jgi:hypothetical protein
VSPLVPRVVYSRGISALIALLHQRSTNVGASWSSGAMRLLSRARRAAVRDSIRPLGFARTKHPNFRKVLCERQHCGSSRPGSGPPKLVSILGDSIPFSTPGLLNAVERVLVTKQEYAHPPGERTGNQRATTIRSSKRQFDMLDDEGKQICDPDPARAISVLLEAGAIRECEEHGWMRDRADPHARERAPSLSRASVRLLGSHPRRLPSRSPRCWMASATPAPNVRFRTEPDKGAPRRV